MEFPTDLRVEIESNYGARWILLLLFPLYPSRVFWNRILASRFPQPFDYLRSDLDTSYASLFKYASPQVCKPRQRLMAL